MTFNTSKRRVYITYFSKLRCVTRISRDFLTDFLHGWCYVDRFLFCITLINEEAAQRSWRTQGKLIKGFKLKSFVTSPVINRSCFFRLSNPKRPYPWKAGYPLHGCDGSPLCPPALRSQSCRPTSVSLWCSIRPTICQSLAPLRRYGTPLPGNDRHKCCSCQL